LLQSLGFDRNELTSVKLII